MLSLFCDWPADFEEQFWSSYPRKVGKGAMRKALEKVRKSGVSFADVLAGLERYKVYIGQRSATCWRPEFCHASTWLHQERWKDEFGGDHAEAPRSISQAAADSITSGFRLGPKPRDICQEGRGDHVRLLAKE